MQVIKLVEMNNVEVEERIKQEIEDNPALENNDGNHIGDADGDDMGKDEQLTQEEMILGDYKSEDDVPDFRVSGPSGKNQASVIDYGYFDDTSLHDYLIEQIGLLDLDERKQLLAEYIVGNIDENGYLQRDLSAIADDLLFQQQIEVTPLHLEDMLYEIQDLDPAGVGARDLQECILLQLRRLEEGQDRDMAIEIITDYFKEFSNKHYDKILKQMQISEQELKGAIDLIITLNPKPGNTIGGAMEASMNNITPDFFVDNYNGELTIYLNNSNIPSLNINREFSEMLKGYNENKAGMNSDDKQAILFMKQKVDSARWFIEAVKQRQNTLQRTMEAIVKIQYDFFINEDETNLKPMILKDVAELTGFDISTISRVSNSKYVQTNIGIYPLKFFFSEAMQTVEGEDISSTEVKRILKECVEKEDSSKPLTDEQLAKILREKGYVIARRTVAKYREQLDIPVSRLRKKI